MVALPHLSAICLDRHLSDHRPIILRELSLDYGPTPFRIFQSWFKLKEFDKVVEESWRNSHSETLNGMIRLKKKLQSLKAAIKHWSKKAEFSLHANKSVIQKNLSDVDKCIDQGESNAELLNHRSSLMKELQDISSIEMLEVSQKAKLQWAIEEDENSKYFQGILNKKRANLAISRILQDGEWLSDPNQVKAEFLNHLSNRFSEPQKSRFIMDFQFANRISLDQNEELESGVSYNEIKKVVWECGLNKSLNLDGFSFDFFRKYWKLINVDVVAAVQELFVTSKFPHGCNSSFIALIPESARC
nr:RNA-directed DNA polymerase, eukaryota [Tanacetum cinerariifolium]